MAYLCHQRQLIKLLMFNLFGKFILGILTMFESIREQETPCEVKNSGGPYSGRAGSILLS